MDLSFARIMQSYASEVIRNSRLRRSEFKPDTVFGYAAASSILCVEMGFTRTFLRKQIPKSNLSDLCSFSLTLS